MKQITDRLWVAVEKIAKMRHPSVAEILRRRGFGHEANHLDELVSAFEETDGVEHSGNGRDQI